MIRIDGYEMRHSCQLLKDIIDKEASPWGGLRLMEEAYRRSGLKQKARRMVVVRKDTDTHPDTDDKLLFREIEEFEKYTYAAFATNVEFSAELVRHLYNQRTDCENRIRLQVFNNRRQPVLSTMRFQGIAIESYLAMMGRKTTLKFSAKQNRRLFLEGLFERVSNLSPPFQISNA